MLQYITAIFVCNNLSDVCGTLFISRIYLRPRGPLGIILEKMLAIGVADTT